MGAALPIRGDVPGEELRRLARLEADGRVACRISALANALDGMSGEQAARQAGMDRQTLRDWVIRFNVEGVAGLRDRPRSGRPALLDEGQMATLKALVLRGPNPERDGVSSWTAKDLCRIALDRLGVSYNENGMLDLLHGLGLSWQKTRPVHPQANPKAQRAGCRGCSAPRPGACPTGACARPAGPGSPVAGGDLQCTGRYQHIRSSCAMPRASLRSVLTTIADSAAFTCRVSSNTASNPALVKPACRQCESGPASSPMRVTATPSPANKPTSASGSLATLISRIIRPLPSTTHTLPRSSETSIPA